MTRLHVVHVLHSLAVGGTENGVVNLIQALDGEVRHSVVSMTGSGPLAARLPSHVELSCLGKRPGLDLWAVARMTRLFRRLRPDVVHSRNWGTFDAILAARLARVPVVIHGEHGREADDPDGRLYQAMIDLAEKRLDKEGLAALLRDLASPAKS